ncbi:ABC transporter substrate-binding protein [Candidatus Woesearchaeota archaeon]|nr:ABC transporter substrate-binding protein [Candidatus Woesearchaeota archaeon]
MNWFWRVIIAVLVIAIVTVTFKPSLFEPKTVTGFESGEIYVGGLLPLTNVPEDKEILFTELRNSMAMAVEEINIDGGIDDKQLTLITGDSQCDSGVAANKALDMIDNYDVSAIIATQCEDELDAVSQLTSSKERILLSITGFAPNLQIMEEELFFKNSLVNNNTMNKLVNLLTNKFNLTSVALMFEVQDYPMKFKEELKKELELKNLLVSEEGFKTTDTEFTAPLRKIQNKNPDAIIILGQTKDTVDILLKEIKDRKMHQLIITNNMISELLETAGNELENVVFIDSAEDVSEEFIQKYNNRFGEELENKFLAASMYDSVYLIKDAIETTTDASGIMNIYLKTVEDYEGSSGIFSIDEHGNIMHDIKLNQIKNNQVYFLG